MGYKTHAVYNIADVDVVEIKKERFVRTQELADNVGYPDLQEPSSTKRLADLVQIVNNRKRKDTEGFKVPMNKDGSPKQL